MAPANDRLPHPPLLADGYPTPTIGWAPDTGGVEWNHGIQTPARGGVEARFLEQAIDIAGEDNAVSCVIRTLSSRSIHTVSPRDWARLMKSSQSSGSAI